MQHSANLFSRVLRRQAHVGSRLDVAGSPVLVRSVGTASSVEPIAAAPRPISAGALRHERLAPPANVVLDQEMRAALHRIRCAPALPKTDASARGMPVDVEAPVLRLSPSAPATGRTVLLDRRIFCTPLRPDVVHRVVVWQQKGARKTLYAAHTRSETRGGGKKPWKQKGTGRARVGTIRSPLWRGGGTAMGPVHRDWSIDLPKKLRRFGLRVALAAKLRDGRLVVVDELLVPGAAGSAGEALPGDAEAGAAPSPKTKDLMATLEARGWLRPGAGPAAGQTASILFVDAQDVPAAFARATSNIERCKALPAGGANVYDIVRAERLVLTTAAVDALTAHLLQDF